MMTTRRAAADEEMNDKLRQRIREILDEKSGEVSDGEVYLFDEPVSKTARIAMRLAMDFPTQEALETYLKKYPDADRSKHKVVETQEEPRKKEDEPKQPREKKEEEPSEKKDKKEEEKSAPVKKEEKPDAKSEEKPKEKSRREIFLGPENPHHPAMAPKGEHRREAIKDALVSEFGRDAVSWRTHKIDKSQLTDNVTVRFPDGQRKKFKDLSDEEKQRVTSALSEGMAATKGMNDYNQVSASAMHRNMENNLATYDDKDVEETKNESSEPVSKEGAAELAKSVRSNARNLVKKYSKAMSIVSEPIMEKCVDDYSDAIREAATDGSLEGVSQSDLDEFVREDVKRLVHQEVETRRRSLGDHGIRHVAGNVRSSMKILAELEGHGTKLTGKQKLMAVAVQMNHDMGYTVGKVATDISKGGEHKEQSRMLAEEEKSRYEKIFGKEDADKIVKIIATHDSNEVDWDKDPVGSAVRLADNTSLFGNDKVQDLFIRNPKTMSLACKLQMTARMEPSKPSEPKKKDFGSDGEFDDATKEYEAKKAEYDKPETKERVKKAKALQKDIKEQMHEAVEGAGFDDNDSDELHKQVDEMSEGKFSTTADILSRYSGKLKGFRFEPEKKMMAVDMSYSPEGEVVDALFGDELAARQFDKFAKDGNVEPMRGKRGKMTFKNNEGKRVFSINIEGFDDEPVSSASTGAMRDFLKKTARGEMRQAAGTLKRKGAGEKEVEKARKALEPAKKKLTEQEWKELMKALEEGKDVAALAAKLDAWPLFESEMSFLSSREASTRRIAAAVYLAEMADRVARGMAAARGLQVVRKDKDTMSDTGGSSKTRDREPDLKPRREDVRKPFRTKNRTDEEKDGDLNGEKDKTDDKDVKTASDFVMKAKMELSRWPRRLAEAVSRMS